MQPKPAPAVLALVSIIPILMVSLFFGGLWWWINYIWPKVLF